MCICMCISVYIYIIIDIWGESGDIRYISTICVFRCNGSGIECGSQASHDSQRGSLKHFCGWKSPIMMVLKKQGWYKDLVSYHGDGIGYWVDTTLTYVQTCECTPIQGHSTPIQGHSDAENGVWKHGNLSQLAYGWNQMLSQQSTGGW